VKDRANRRVSEERKISPGEAKKCRAIAEQMESPKFKKQICINGKEMQDLCNSTAGAFAAGDMAHPRHSRGHPPTVRPAPKIRTVRPIGQFHPSKIIMYFWHFYRDLF
jgi:hypothetical protein